MNDKELDYFRTLIIHNYLSVVDKAGAREASAGRGINSFRNADNLNRILQNAGKGAPNSGTEEKLYFFNRDEKYIKHLIAALERIEKKEYGLCSTCGKEIPGERLEEVPHTRYCVSCKNNTE